MLVFGAVQGLDVVVIRQRVTRLCLMVLRDSLKVGYCSCWPENCKFIHRCLSCSLLIRLFLSRFSLGAVLTSYLCFTVDVDANVDYHQPTIIGFSTDCGEFCSVSLVGRT